MDYPNHEKPVLVQVLMRFKRYKPNSQQYKAGLVGRWQEFNGYGWNNCEPPESWREKE